MTRTTQLTADALAAAARDLERATATDIVAWAVAELAPSLVLAASFQDCVLIDIVHRIEPGIEVVFLDTGSHFPETLAYVRRVRERYGLHLTTLAPAVDPCEHPCGSERCCELRKVAPLERYFAEQGVEGWLTGLKRVDTPERRDAPVVGLDERRNMVKVNPLATWTEEDVAGYVALHDLPVHPLTALGYSSIGCAPATVPVRLGQNPRAGRWAGLAKTECGLHLP